MKEKLISLSRLLLSFILFSSCHSQDKFDWNAGFSAPKNYIAGDPAVAYFYKGNNITGASSLVGIDPGWGETSGGFTAGAALKPVPDSVFVKWRCGFELVSYEAGFKLPSAKMISLFNTKPVDPLGAQVNYSLIVTGMAPGGNVTVWMKAGLVTTEIAKFKAKALDTANKNDPKSGITLWTSTGTAAKEILTYINIHGVPYDSWKKEAQTYRYDIGFSSEDAKNDSYSKAVTGLSKDGTPIYADAMGNTLNDVKPGSTKVALDNRGKNKLPVQLAIQWISPDDSVWYESAAVLPLDFEDQCIKFKNQYGDFVILVSMEKTESGSDYTFGKIYLLNDQHKQLVMRFRAAKLNNDTRNFYVSKYSLPKGFVFPKWEGKRIPTFPKLDYWQEPLTN
jgi:hypothetical protein